MIHPLLEKHIPAKGYVKYLNEIGHQFSDFETAAILSHIYDGKLGKCIEVLSEFLPDVKDDEVKKQIEDYIEEKWQDMAAFTDNKDGEGVFIACARYKCEGGYCGEEILSCSTDYSAAHKACRNFAAAEADDVEFTDTSIKKFFLERDGFINREKEYHYLNPFLFADMPMEELKVESIVQSNDAGEIIMSKEGCVEHLWIKKEESEESARHIYDPDLFYNAYISYPNPFELGDIVRLVEADEVQSEDELPKKIGIIYESQEQYIAFESRVKNGEFPTGSIDQFDCGTTAEWLTSGGDFSHDHDKRIFLEKYEMPGDDPRKELMEAASWLIQGKGGLDYFTEVIKGYKMISRL